MTTTLNSRSYCKLFDEDLAWLLKQPRTLEREHITDALIWLRDNYELVVKLDPHRLGPTKGDEFPQDEVVPELVRGPVDQGDLLRRVDRLEEIVAESAYSISPGDYCIVELLKELRAEISEREKGQS